MKHSLNNLYNRFRKYIKFENRLLSYPKANNRTDSNLLKHSDRKFKILIEESSDIFCILSINGTINYVSNGVRATLGRNPEELIGESIFKFCSQTESDKLKNIFNQFRNYSVDDICEVVLLKDSIGNDRYLETKIQNMLNDPHIQGIVLNLRDVTDKMEVENRIRFILNHDDVSGLPNRNYLKKKLKELCCESKNNNKFCLMLINIGGYKYITDTMGLKAGEHLLIKTANKLREYFKTEFIARYTQDQLIIIIEGNKTIEDYENIIKDIIEMFSEPLLVDMYELDVSINIGVSINEGSISDPEIIIKHANIALFLAKKEGKNKYKFYSKSVNIQNFKQFHLRSQMRKALDQDEFRIHYQPIVRLSDNKILAVEAFIRWEHPDWGLVMPNEFISLAEETGFIIKLGSWIVKEVCKEYKKWLDAGLTNIKIAINISNIQIYENNFVENIKNIIKSYDLNPEFLIMEITESTFLKNTDKVINDIKELQSFGIQFALDDFGTGYSALEYLNTFNIDILKIDKSFIKDMSDRRSWIITRSIINLCKDLNIKIIAEGIETPEQLSCLRKLKCYAGQGFLFRKPASVNKIKEMLSGAFCVPVISSTDKYKVSDKRRYFRISFSDHLNAKLSIVKFKGNKINVGNTKISIKNISAGGLCFTADIKLPVEKSLLLRFETELLNRNLCVYGNIVWVEECDNNIYEYGVEFVMDDKSRLDLLKMLNLYQIKISKHHIN